MFSFIQIRKLSVIFQKIKVFSRMFSFTMLEFHGIFIQIFSKKKNPWNFSKESSKLFLSYLLFYNKKMFSQSKAFLK